jgi:pimeloyl-ACP methyl ester carboxylesterase
MFCVTAFVALTLQAQTPAAKVKYGSNAAAGQTFVHDGVKLYYEVYGAGEPLLLIHTNGGSIADFNAQIDYFRQHYRVIAMDNRDQGKSADSPGKLTYEKMTDDLAALLDHVKAQPAYVLGWSDGGIEGMLLGVRYPAKVKKIAAMAANLNPEGLHPEALKLVKSMLAAIPVSQRNTPAGKRELKVTQMMLDEPHIDPKALEKISAPVLVMASDHDLISDQHTLEIFHHIPNGELCIFPNATHTMAFDEPALFNATVERFFRTPYRKRDRVGDVMKSFEAMRKQ